MKVQILFSSEGDKTILQGDYFISSCITSHEFWARHLDNLPFNAVNPDRIGVVKDGLEPRSDVSAS